MNDASASSGSPADASSIKEKAQDATGKAQDTVRRELDERTSQAGEKVSGTAEDIRSIGEELRKQGKDGPGKLADRAAEQTEKVGSYLSGNGPDEMLHDLEDFGRRRPWALLAGGLLAGAAAARFLKASSRSRYEGRSSDASSPSRPLGAEGANRPLAVPSPSPSANGGAGGHSATPGATLPTTPEPAAAPGAAR